MAPLVACFRDSSAFSTKVCVTAQHREMLDQVLAFFSLVPDYDLNLMSPNQTLFGLSAKALTALEPVLEDAKPDVIFVQGDTTTVLVSALGAFYKKIKVAHIEAGLRSFDRYSPFPEEVNRVLTTHLTDFHFAPTPQAAENLKREGVARGIHVVGNTVIDALFLALAIIQKTGDAAYRDRFAFLDFSKKTILVTCHRRESFGEPFAHICDAFLTIARRFPDVQLVYPVHLNPNIKETAHAVLGKQPNIHLIPPLPYPELVWLMNASYLVLTDSGGIQEEAPSLGKPVLVLRDVTERMEGVTAGTAKLVGTDREKIVAEASRLLTDPAYYEQFAKAVNPYGDGKAAQRVLEILLDGK